jgi:hypothetical protein
MKMTCAHAVTCLPDYWSGHHLAHVQIPVTRRKMSLAEIRRAIRSELRQGAVMGNSEDAQLLSDGKHTDAVTRAAYAAVNRDVIGSRKGQRYADTGVTEFGDDDETVYMFFVFQLED